VQVIGYADNLSKLETVLGSATIGPDGSYRMEFLLDETCLSFFEIGFRRGELYLMPGHSYTVNCTIGQEQYYFNFSQQENLRLQISDPAAPDLNRMIQDFNQLYNRLMLEQFNDAYSRISKEQVKNLVDTLEISPGNADLPYFHNYVRYRLALLELSSRIKSRESIAEEYLNAQPILYNNIEYIEFFIQFFSQFLLTSPREIPVTELKDMVNEAATYHSLEERLNRFTYITGAEFRELALLKGLMDLYHTGGYERQQILTFYKQLASQSRFEKIREIANNLVTVSTRFARGTRAPEITVHDKDGQEKKLTEINASPTYVIFYSSKNLSCIAELDMVGDIMKEFKGKISFISLSLDPSMETMDRVRQERGYEWPFYFAGNDRDLVRKYGIQRLPKCILLNTDGTFLDYSAPAPSENLAGYLYRVLHD
jgi:peroxiredoxin